MRDEIRAIAVGKLANAASAAVETLKDLLESAVRLGAARANLATSHRKIAAVRRLLPAILLDLNYANLARKAEIVGTPPGEVKRLKSRQHVLEHTLSAPRRKSLFRLADS